MENDESSNDGDYEKQSKFNSGIQQIMRLSSLKQKAHAYAETLNLDQYEILLDRIRIEIAADFSKEQEQEIIKIRSEIKAIRKIRTGFKPNEMNLEDYPEIRRRVKVKNSMLKNCLEKYEVALKKIENKLGLGTLYRNESDEGID